jgi:hypothetical protein
MTLAVNSDPMNVRELSEIGPGFITLREPVDLPASEGTVTVKIDEVERCWNVTLPKGASSRSEHVTVQARPV